MIKSVDTAQPTRYRVQLEGAIETITVTVTYVMKCQVKRMIELPEQNGMHVKIGNAVKPGEIVNRLPPQSGLSEVGQMKARRDLHPGIQHSSEIVKNPDKTIQLRPLTAPLIVDRSSGNSPNGNSSIGKYKEISPITGRRV